MKVKLSGLMKACRVAKNAPAKPPNMAPMREGRQLGVGRIDAERAAGDLVLAQRFPGAAERQAAQAQGEPVGQQREREDHVIEEDDPLARAEVDAEELRRRSCRRRRARLNGRPNKVGRGMPLMPFGPLVSDTQLMQTMRMISPKASVTMAR